MFQRTCLRNLVGVDTKSGYLNKRNFVGIFRRYKMNRVDEQKLKYIGADKTAAEWILSCGGKIKMAGSDRWVTSLWDFDYHKYDPSYKLTDISADSTQADSRGFRHIKNVVYIRSASFANCKYLDDDALPHLFGSAASGQLKKLDLSGTSISSAGLDTLSQMKSLRILDIRDCRNMADLRHAPELPGLLEELKQELPQCRIMVRSQGDDKLVGRESRRGLQAKRRES